MNYYNENDPKAAAWLRALIEQGLIPHGFVDERSIADVQPNDLAGFTQCHFFAGIGGWSLALKLAGWPDDREVWTGSCPCQPFSVSGKRLGTRDPRHLWPQFRRLIRLCRPSIIFGEQVASADGRVWLDGVCADLEALAYVHGAADLCAAGVGAPHIRSRLYWMAYSLRSKFNWGGDRGTGGSNLQTVAGLANTPSSRSKRTGEGVPHEGREKRELISDEPNGSIGLLANANGEQNISTEPGQSVPGPRRPASGLVNADCARLQRHGQSERDSHSQKWGGQDEKRYGPDAGFWNDATWHQCRDGKKRRISPKSSLFPLAHGVSGRVGLLRGAGNAIVPPLAAEFIKACAEALNEVMS